MSIPGSALPLLLASPAGAAGGYEIERSLRFNRVDSAYLSKTFGSAGNTKLWTFSFWYKSCVSKDPSEPRRHIFTARNASGHHCIINFRGSEDKFEVYFYNGSLVFQVLTTAVYRDPSAWGHYMVVFDTDQSTPANRVKMYANGVQITQFATANYPSQGYSQALWNSAEPQTIGRDDTTYLDGYLADVHFIDGQALTPTSFGEFDATTGVWNPIEYTGSYGTNGFHLDFADNSSAAALGYDAAGSNNWTVNNISVASGAGNDSLRDSPTNGDTANDTGAGGEVPGNYCTLNPLWNNGHVLSNGNLNYAPPSPEAWTSVLSTFGMSSGKWYWEQTYISGGANCMAGFGNSSSTIINYPTSPNSLGYDFVDGNIYGASAGAQGATLSAGNIMGIALDVDAGTADFYKNGVKQGSTLTHGITGTLFPLVSSYDGVGCVNFGQRPFAYSAPSGYKALCTANLDTPTIADPSTVMDVALYTGNAPSTQTITGLGFSPDMVWIKNRSVTGNHIINDIVRGAGQRLITNLTNSEATDTDRFSAFTSDG